MERAEAAADRSPQTWPLSRPFATMMSTPVVIAAMATKVARRGFSPRTSQESSAPNIGLKARMKATFAEVVLNTESMKKTVDAA